MYLQILGPEVTLCSKKHFDILSGSIETGREVGGHDYTFAASELQAIYRERETGQLQGFGIKLRC
jgi:hypothetical protein